MDKEYDYMHDLDIYHSLWLYDMDNYTVLILDMDKFYGYIT